MTIGRTHVRLVCTVVGGLPGGEDRPQNRADYLDGLVRAGLDVARVNLSHVRSARDFSRGEVPRYENSEALLTRIREADARGDPDHHVAILLDLQGIKLRLHLPGGRRGDGREVAPGEELRLVFGRPAKEGEIACDGSERVLRAVRQALTERGSLTVAVGDGSPILTAFDQDDEGLLLRANDVGTIGQGKGVTFRGVELPDEPALTEKDRIDLAAFVVPALLEQRADFVALSFTRSADDVRRLRNFAHDCVRFFREGALPVASDDADLLRRLADLRPDLTERYRRGTLRLQIVAKIETLSGVENIESIIPDVEAVMVARGDLGLACSPQDVPRIQKDILRAARLQGRPVIVATQMLGSMEVHPEPTRPEAADVFNAVLDGADALMLSGETATGNRPHEAARTLLVIADAAESWERERLAGRRVGALNMLYREILSRRAEDHERNPLLQTTDDVTYSAVRLAESLGARALVAWTRSGTTARHLARFAPEPLLLAVVPSPAVARRLALTGGARALVVPSESDRPGTRSSITRGIRQAVELGLLSSGDLVVMASAGVDDPPGVTLRVEALTVR